MKNLEYNSNTESLDNFHTHDIKLIDPRKWKKNKIICIVQARYSSSRFPGKILKKINKKNPLV